MATRFYMSLGTQVRQVLTYKDIYDNKPPLYLTAAVAEAFWFRQSFWNWRQFIFYKLAEKLFPKNEKGLK